MKMFDEIDRQTAINMQLPRNFQETSVPRVKRLGGKKSTRGQRIMLHLSPGFLGNLI